MSRTAATTRCGSGTAGSRFYLRQGADLLPVSGYRTPYGSAEDPGWTPMRLMAAPLTAGQPVSVIPEIVAAVYRYRWSLAPDHPQVTGTVVADQARRLG